jgi:hypothetical protein
MRRHQSGRAGAFLILVLLVVVLLLAAVAQAFVLPQTRCVRGQKCACPWGLWGWTVKASSVD